MSEAEHSKWVQGWSDFMVKMWQEKMLQFAPPVYDTGALAFGAGRGASGSGDYD